MDEKILDVAALLEVQFFKELEFIVEFSSVAVFGDQAASDRLHFGLPVLLAIFLVFNSKFLQEETLDLVVDVHGFRFRKKFLVALQFAFKELFQDFELLFVD